MLCVQSGLSKSWYCALGSHEDSRGRWYDQPGDTWKSNCSRPCWRCDWEKHLLATWTWSDRLRGRCYVPGEEIWSFLQLVPNKKYPVSSCRREDLDCWTLTLTSLFSRCWIRQPCEVEEKVLALGQRSSTLQPNHFPLHLCVNSRSQRKSTTSVYGVVGTAVIWLHVKALTAKPFRVWQSHFLPFGLKSRLFGPVGLFHNVLI